MDDPLLEETSSHSIFAAIDTTLDILHSKLLFKKKEVDYDLELRELRLEAKQRIARKKLQDTIKAHYLKEGITDDL